VYGNSVATVAFTEASDKLKIVSTVTVEQYESTIAVLDLADDVRQFPFEYDAIEKIDLIACQTPVFENPSGIFRTWLDSLWLPGNTIDTTQLLHNLGQKIIDDVQYTVRYEPGVQSPETTLLNAKGSCRDLATLFIEACRHFGLASRFVSGYLVSVAAVEDVATTHAWAEVYLPGVGWQGFDSTSGQMVGGDHIAVAVHRHPEAIPPVSGSFIGPAVESKMQVNVNVKKLS
jgi:transglutaminase/protease-like cytokinesis protein 3